ncbi:MAG TPA: bifunctional glutamate N-acetyltransferase/amino-acid acetyltransferase ArgJ [Methylomirabilota bacterium]|nr:bifunctional glutamate N-acetyltransferase/amino-acid acetyltransferase ArgJ [Methylomirabilota bacterium]
MSDWEWLRGGITAVPGVMAAGIHSGIKASGKKDLALIHSTRTATAAGCFTTNQVKGAPVQVSMEHLKAGVGQAIVASSGNANTCTGEQGLKDAREMTKIVSELLRIPPRHVFVASTGVIGQPLPIEKIRGSLPKLVKALSPQGGKNAAEAIMTTDTVPKEAALRVEVAGRPVTIGGLAKGSGMVHPNMATMFCFLATDLAVARPQLQTTLRRAADQTVNRITIDGDRSTSDTLLILANGLAENKSLDRPGADLRVFARALHAIMERFAKLLVADAEGATKVVEIVVKGAANRRDALSAARGVASSLLVKTALNGQDPNWGRLMAALGASGAAIQPDRVGVWFADEPVAVGGQLTAEVRWGKVREVMLRKEFTILIDLGLGNAQDHYWTSDLSEEYVRINTKYTT